MSVYGESFQKKSEMKRLMEEFHDQKEHAGRDAMLGALRKTYGWHGMKKAIEDYLCKRTTTKHNIK